MSIIDEYCKLYGYMTMEELLRDRMDVRSKLMHWYKNGGGDPPHNSKLKSDRLLAYLCCPFEEWEYAGGDNEHLSYWEYMSEKYNLQKPLHESYCGCSTGIENNFYIRNTKTNEVVVIGSECIERYNKDGRMRKCHFCHKSHNNRKYILCNDCGKDSAGKWMKKVVDMYMKSMKETRRSQRCITSFEGSGETIESTNNLVHCKHCDKVLKKFTSNSERNPGRQYYACRDCKFFKWADQL